MVFVIEPEVLSDSLKSPEYGALSDPKGSPERGQLPRAFELNDEDIQERITPKPPYK